MTKISSKKEFLKNFMIFLSFKGFQSFSLLFPIFGNLFEFFRVFSNDFLC